MVKRILRKILKPKKAEVKEAIGYNADVVDDDVWTLTSGKVGFVNRTTTKARTYPIRR